uniref:Deleted in azoospermia-like n=1 Tax=Salarias fasciatus TaxID=181472 RepID=A0A672FVT0_SALFA
IDINKSRSTNQTFPTLKLSNGYILPEGKVTPNTLFVGGIDLKVDENEIRDFFARYGSVKEVKIITYRGGICKGYGFVYFSEEVNIQAIIEQQISFKGRKLKLGPAIMKDRGSRGTFPSRMVGPSPWPAPPQYFFCACCSPMGGGLAPSQPSPIMNGSGPYSQPYFYNNFGGVMMPQMPMNYTQNPYTYQVRIHLDTLNHSTHGLSRHTHTHAPTCIQDVGFSLVYVHLSLLLPQTIPQPPTSAVEASLGLFYAALFNSLPISPPHTVCSTSMDGGPEDTACR